MKTKLQDLTPEELKKLRSESRRTGYSPKQLLEIRAEHARDEQLDREADRYDEVAAH